MGQSYYQYNNQQLHHQQGSGSTRLKSSGGRSSGGGEIVEVDGGYIVRSTGRKDRHSKVCTSKGPRDRRIRLSAHTAIQFYDVQDRLGYDRPSKAVDWLIKKAKTAIDKLAELPAWKPTATVTRIINPCSASVAKFDQNPDELNHFDQHPNDSIVDNSSFLPQSLDSDSIADTIKSFFPMGGCSNPVNNNHSSSAMLYHQDLKLSLHNHPHPHHQQAQQVNNSNSNSNIYFDGSGWSDNQAGGLQRIVSWGGDAGGGFVFSSPTAPSSSIPCPLFGQTITNELLLNNYRRESLQSSSTATPSFRGISDRPSSASSDSRDLLSNSNVASLKS